MVFFMNAITLDSLINYYEGKWQFSRLLTNRWTCTCSYIHLERLVSTVGQHVSLEPALTRGWSVINFTSLPQTHKHLEEDKEETRMIGRADTVGVKSLQTTWNLWSNNAKYQLSNCNFFFYKVKECICTLIVCCRWEKLCNLLMISLCYAWLWANYLIKHKISKSKETLCSSN